MANLKEVRDRIVSVKSTQQITKAMKMVAAAKLRKAQDAIIQLRPYAKKLDSLLSRVSSGENNQGVFSEVRDVENVLVVVVTSDRGLCGGFNSNVIKATSALIEKKYAAQKETGNLDLMCLGNRGNEHFLRYGFNVISDYVGVFHDINFEKVRLAAEYAMNGFEQKKYDVVEIVYNEFKNVAVQIVKSEQFLPIAEASSEGENTSEELEYIYEPNKETIVKELIPKSLKIKFFKSVLESNASEHGARMTAMDNATENAGELIKSLNIEYNRSRQAAITTEILEIVGGAEALANG